MNEVVPSAAARRFATRSHASGSPRLIGRLLAESARERGEARTWLPSVLAEGAERAASRAMGGFAASLSAAQGRTFLTTDRLSVQPRCRRQLNGQLHFAGDFLRSLAGRGIVRPDNRNRLPDHQLPQRSSYCGGMVWVLLILEQLIRQQANAALAIEQAK